MTKGRKRTKGVPDLHDELKTRVNLSLTPKAVEGLDALAAGYLVSRSEFVERIGRGLIPIGPISSVPFSKRENLPDRPGIGLVISGSQILYIGQGIEIKRLEPSNSLVRLADDSDKMFVAWIECSETALLPLIETALVAVYTPQSPESRNRETEGRSFSRWMESLVLKNFSVPSLVALQRDCKKALALKGFFADDFIPDIPADCEGGIKITPIYEYNPPPRWLKSTNGGMYEVSAALSNEEELHELPEDLRRRVLEIRIQEGIKPYTLVDEETEQTQENPISLLDEEIEQTQENPISS